MDIYFLKTSNGTFILKRKLETLGDGLTYTESGNDITVTGYTGSNTDVILVNRTEDMFCLARPTPYIPEYRLNVTDYEYTNNDGDVILTLYTGNGGEVDTPQLEEI